MKAVRHGNGQQVTDRERGRERLGQRLLHRLNPHRRDTSCQPLPRGRPRWPMVTAARASNASELSSRPRASISSCARSSDDSSSKVDLPSSATPEEVAARVFDASLCRSAFLDGYSPHADRLIDANDCDGLERLARYGARSPVADRQLSALARFERTGRALAQASLARRANRARVQAGRLLASPRDPHSTTAHPSHPVSWRLCTPPQSPRCSRSSRCDGRSCRSESSRPTPSSRLGLTDEARVRDRCSRVRRVRRSNAHPRRPPRGRRQSRHSRAPRPAHRASQSPHPRSTRSTG